MKWGEWGEVGRRGFQVWRGNIDPCHCHHPCLFSNAGPYSFSARPLQTTDELGPSIPNGGILDDVKYTAAIPLATPDRHPARDGHSAKTDLPSMFVVTEDDRSSGGVHLDECPHRPQHATCFRLALFGCGCHQRAQDIFFVTKPRCVRSMQSGEARLTSPNMSRT